MPWAVAAAAVAAAGSAYAADQQKKGAKKASDAQAQGAQASVDEQRRQYDQTRADQQPWLQTGQFALDRQQQFLNGNMSNFHDSPDYAYTRDQMVQGLDRSAAARGRLYSGGYGVDMATHLNGLASQNANNYWNRLAGLSGTGQNSAQSLGGFGASMASNIGNAYGNAANARASSYQQSADANSQFGAGLGNTAAGLIGQYGASRTNGQASNSGSLWGNGSQPSQGYDYSNLMANNNWQKNGWGSY